MSDPSRPVFIPALPYRDNRAALAWLERAFGFAPNMIIEAGDDIVHAEMGLGEALIMVGREWHPRVRSPANLDGFSTQTVHVHLQSDLDAHCERARLAGARIEQEPETQFYGDRTYRAFDLDGHLWTFGQTVRTVSPAEWDAAEGLRTSFPDR